MMDCRWNQMMARLFNSSCPLKPFSKCHFYLVNLNIAFSLLRTPWLIEEQMAVSYFEEYRRISASGGSFREEEKKERFKPRQKFFADSSIRFAPTDDYSNEALTFNGFDGSTIAVINICGPLMKADFCGQLGTKSILSLFNLAANTESVQEIIVVIDSPGGTVDGTFSLADEINECKKPVTAIIDGMCCSAAYWIASSADTIFASAPTNIVGSIGTMIQLVDQSKALENQGVIIRSFTAEESANKNLEFSEAMKGDGKMLVQNLLNPINDAFINAVKAARPTVAKDALTGKIYIGNDGIAVGLIDEVKCMDDVIADIQSRIVQISNSQQLIKSSMTPFKKTLTAASATEFKVVEGGFMLNEANLLNIEAALTAAESLVTVAESTHAAAAKVVTELATANTTIIALQTKVIEMGKNDGARFSTSPVAAIVKNKDGDTVVALDTDPKIGAVVVDNSAFETEYDKELKAMKDRASL